MNDGGGTAQRGGGLLYQVSLRRHRKRGARCPALPGRILLRCYGLLCARVCVHRKPYESWLKVGV